MSAPSAEDINESVPNRELILEGGDVELEVKGDVEQEGSSRSSTSGVDNLKETAPFHIINLYVSVVAYNIFTLTDGAIRMVVLLHAATLGKL